MAILFLALTFIPIFAYPEINWVMFWSLIGTSIFAAIAEGI